MSIESRTLAAGRSLVAEGLYPSLDRLAPIVGESVGLIVAARRALVSKGDWPVSVKNPAPIPAEDGEARRRTRRKLGPRESGLNGRNPREIRQVERAAAEIRGDGRTGIDLPVIDPWFTLGSLTSRAFCRLMIARHGHLFEDWPDMDDDRIHAPFDPSDEQITEAAWNAAMSDWSETMTVNELARLVADMRKAQRTYFRDRTQGDLNTSKRLEGEVDRAVRDVLNGSHAQAGLFDSQDAAPPAGGHRAAEERA